MKPIASCISRTLGLMVTHPLDSHQTDISARKFSVYPACLGLPCTHAIRLDMSEAQVAAPRLDLGCPSDSRSFIDRRLTVSFSCIYPHLGGPRF